MNMVGEGTSDHFWSVDDYVTMYWFTDRVGALQKGVLFIDLGVLIGENGLQSQACCKQA